MNLKNAFKKAVLAATAVASLATGPALAAGNNVNAQDKNGMTEMHRLVGMEGGYYCWDSSWISGYPGYQCSVSSPQNAAVIEARIKTLIDSGADLSIRDKTGKTPVEKAEACRQPELANFMRMTHAEKERTTPYKPTQTAWRLGR